MCSGQCKDVKGVPTYSCLCKDCNAGKEIVVCPTYSGQVAQEAPSPGKAQRLTLPYFVKLIVDGFSVLVVLLGLLRSTTFALIQGVTMQQNSVLG